MKSGDFEPWFYRRIVEHFGGYKQAKKELGITTKRKKAPYEVTELRKASDIRRRKYSDEYLVEETRGFIHKYAHLGEVYDNESKIMSAITRRFGNIHKLAEEYSIMLPPVKSRRKWTDERIRNELKEAVEKVKSTASTRLVDSGYRSLVDAVKRHYGTWNAGLVALGYEVAYEYRDPSDNLTKEETKEKVLNVLAKGIRPTRGALEKEIKGLKRSIDVNFGGIDELKKYCGFCAIDDRPSKKETKARAYRPDLMTVEGIKREIIRMWYIGAPMNYAYVREKRGHVLDAVNKHVGSWRKAVESIGLNYADVSVSTNVLSECGTDFEELFAEILTELGYEYIREGEGVSEVDPEFTLKPDFILPNWRWIDCKLSEWTDIRETLIRYHAEKPNGITIVYLRGQNRRRQRGRKWKYEHVSVYKYTELLTKDKREYYEARLREIEEKAKEGAVA